MYKNNEEGRNMFFKRAKRIKELEENVSKLEQELEKERELAADLHMQLQFKEWDEERTMKQQNQLEIE